jgi:general secretion pathway protein D
MKRALLSIFVVWGITACSSGGGGEEKGGSPPPALLAVIAVSSAPGAVNSGDEVRRTIEGRGLGKISYAAFDVAYDPNVLEYVRGIEGEFFKQDGHASTSFRADLVGGSAGRIAVGAARLGQVEGVSGTGTIATLTFKAVGSGQSALAFKDPRGLRNRDNQPVTVDRWEDGIVTVR